MKHAELWDHLADLWRSLAIAFLGLAVTLYLASREAARRAEELDPDGKRLKKGK